MVDHEDRDGLNNTRGNLRVCVVDSFNSANKIKCPGKSSQFKGVAWIVRDKKWRARAVFDGKTSYLGHFDKEVDAALAYDKEAKRLFGDFALLNFPLVEALQPAA